MGRGRQMKVFSVRCHDKFIFLLSRHKNKHKFTRQKHDKDQLGLVQYYPSDLKLSGFE